MKRIILLLHLLIGITLSSIGQAKLSIHGFLKDSLQRQQLYDATVSIIDARDSSIIAFTRTDTAGYFHFSNLQKGTYRLSASHVNFHDTWKTFQLDGQTISTDFGNILMTDKSILQTININSQRPPVVVNGDTLEFNAEGFKTKPNAVVEDMLRKMPGVEIDKNGAVTINGKRINRVLVNGKDFFNGDPTIATRNLSADAIDKVQVFDKPSDQSAFTGVDDGNAEKTINLKLKKDKMNAAFGKASLAAGTDSRIEGKFNLNKFKAQKQLSALGMANNTNQQGFAIMDVLNFTGENKKMMKGGGGIMINSSGPETGGVPVSGLNNNDQGITRTIAGGINYSDNWNNKTDLNTSYFFNDLNTNNQRNIFRQNILQGNNFSYSEVDNSNNRSTTNRINLAVDQSIDSFNSIKFTSNFAVQNANSYNNNKYYSLNEKSDSINNGNAQNSNNSNGYNGNANMLFKHKFAKKGRTISLNTALQYNNSALTNINNSLNRFFNNGVVFKIDTLDQLNKINSITQSFGANVVYTEPLSKKALLEFRTFYNSGSGNLDKNTYDANQSTGKHDLKNFQLSNAFRNNYNVVGGGLSFRGLLKKLTYSGGFNIESDNLKSKVIDSSLSINHNSLNVLPLATFNYNLTRFKTIKLEYNTAVTQPTSSQLQPIRDVTDPLNIKQGNPSLVPSYTHTIGLQYFSTNIAKQSNLIAFANFNTTSNAIVSSDIINTLGQRFTTPVNANGLYTFFGVIEKGLKVKEIATRINFGSSMAYNHNINFINNQKEKSGNLIISPRINLAYSYKELLDISVGTRWNINHVKYSLQQQLDNNYLKQNYTADATLNLSGFSFNTDMVFTINKGRTDGYNHNTAMWNAALAKQILKSKKGELKLSVYNILNQNIGIDRNANFNYIEDVRYTTLQRFFTLGFTYSLQKPSTGGPKIMMRTF